uniref:Uncharacterized protein n=1 Tax=Panagrolaimus sp. ES5 TaxID=591445 RepID=A0AC34G925_9BILA
AILRALRSPQTHYTKEIYINKANAHFNECPPDYMQAAEQCWGGCVFALKLKMFELGYGVTSLRALSAVEELSLKACCDAEFVAVNPGMITDLCNGWAAGHQMYRFHYGEAPFDVHYFEEKMQKAVFFIENVEKLDGAKIKKSISAKIAELEAPSLENDEEEKKRQEKLRKIGFRVRRAGKKDIFILNGILKKNVTHVLF